MRHEIVECEQGKKALSEALAYIDGRGWEVVAIVPNTGGPTWSAMFSGDSYGLMIVVKKPVGQVKKGTP